MYSEDKKFVVLLNKLRDKAPLFREYIELTRKDRTTEKNLNKWLDKHFPSLMLELLKHPFIFQRWMVLVKKRWNDGQKN